MVDKTVVSALSEMVIMVTREGTDLTSIENVEAIFDGLVFLRVKVRRLTDTSYLLSVSYPVTSCSLYSTADGLLGREIRSGDVTLQRWTPLFGSVGTAMFSSADLRIRGLPCNLCTPVVIEYVLGPFCLVKTHLTTINEPGSVFGKSVFSYRCSVWYEDLARIPSRIRVKLIPLELADTTVLSTQEIAMMRSLDISVVARIN
jgi:hypothetical protein